jgi:hypothetical protein
MATVSTYSANWVNTAKQAMPVKYTLKSEDPANGLSKEAVEKAVNYASKSYKNVKLPADSYAAVFRDSDNKNNIGGLLAVKDDVMLVRSNSKDEEKGLYAVVDKIGSQLEVMA